MPFRTLPHTAFPTLLRSLARQVLLHLLLIGVSTSASAAVIRVNANAPGPTHNGASWPTGFLTVQAGLNAAATGDEVWVAASSPAAPAYMENITLKDGVALYGGFAGTETARSQRDGEANVTILNGSGSTTANVVTSGFDAVIDGFTVRSGGNGIYVGRGPLIVANCTISGNSSWGIDAYGASAIVANCSITSNSYGTGGGGITMAYGTVTVTNSTVSGNGDGIYVDAGGTAEVTGCTISSNSDVGVNAAYGTAGVSNSLVSGNDFGVWVWSGTAIVSDCTLCGNLRTGVWVTPNGTANVTNCTLSSNLLDGVAVGDFLHPESGGKAAVTNCILAFNGYGIRRASTSVIVDLSHNDVFGNVSANYWNDDLSSSHEWDATGSNGNVSLDPKLSNPRHHIHIQPTSPCVDLGDDSAVHAGWTDIDGQPRIVGAHVDIGSDESDGTYWTVPPQTWFVSPMGHFAADGLSWATAKQSLGDSLGLAESGDEIWVMLGTYYENVTLKAGVALYGGFAGTERSRNQRDWKANVTVLDGGGYGGSNGVVAVPSAGSVLDGFTIRNGGNSGVYVSASSAIANSVITGNSASYGGGIHIDSGDVQILNDTISGNTAAFYGGGIFATGSITLQDNTIAGNNCPPRADGALTAGGGIYAYGPETTAGETITRNTISGNSSDFGGGLYLMLDANHIVRAAVTNNLIAGNTGRTSGGGLYVANADATDVLANNTIVHNSAAVSGGGLTAVHSAATIANNVIAFNASGMRRPTTDHELTLRSNDVFGNTAYDYDGLPNPTGSNGNLSADPQFSNPGNSDFHPTARSPCLDAGDDSVVTPGALDLDGKPRIVGAHVDIGAYEYAVATGPFSIADAARALYIAGGLATGQPNETARMRVESGTAVDMRDVVRIARKVAGLEANP